MAFRPRREHRKRVLLREGFLPFEAHELSARHLSHMGMKGMRKARRQKVRQARREHWTKKAYVSKVRELYTDNDWTIPESAIQRDKEHPRGRAGKIGQADPWAMFRFWRQKAIEDGEYEKPARRRGRREIEQRKLDKVRKRQQERAATKHMSDGRLEERMRRMGER